MSACEPVVAIIGDSLSSRDIGGEPTAWADQIGSPYTVLIACQGGERAADWADNTGTAAGRLDSEITETPDIVVIMLGTNDSDGMPGTTAAQFELDLRRIKSAELDVRWPGVKIMVVHSPPIRSAVNDRVHLLDEYRHVSETLHAEWGAGDMVDFGADRPGCSGIHYDLADSVDGTHYVLSGYTKQAPVARAALDVIFFTPTLRTELQARYPNLIDWTDPAQVALADYALVDAQDDISETIWKDRYERGVMLLAAAYATLEVKAYKGRVGALNPVSAATADGVSTTFAIDTASQVKGLEHVMSTQYGQQYAALLRRVTAGPRLV